MAEAKKGDNKDEFEAETHKSQGAVKHIIFSEEAISRLARAIARKVVEEKFNLVEEADINERTG